MSAESVIAEFIATQAGITTEEATPQALDLIEALAETHAIVELPNQVDGWWPGGNSEIHIDGRDVVQVSFGRSIYRSVPMTRALATGLLAAANAIEVSR